MRVAQMPRKLRLLANSTKFLVVSGSFVCGLVVNAADNPQCSDFDSHSAELHLARGQHFPTLHELPSGPDGVKSLSFEVEELPTKILGPVQPPFATMSELQAFFQYCAFPNIVLAKSIDSRAVLSAARDDIYTVSHFAVLESLRGELKPGDTVVAYRVGGEVVDGGEKLRIDTPNAPPYLAGREYLLRLHPDVNASVRQYAVPPNGTLLVKNGRLYPKNMLSDDGTWAGFFPGTEYDKVAETLKRVAMLKPCP